MVAQRLISLPQFGSSHLFPLWFGPSLVLYLVLGLGAVLGVFVLIFIVTCLCERQYLVGDVEPASEPYPYPPSPYWRATREAAFQLGLQHAGDFATKRNTSSVKGLLTLCISQDRNVVAAISSGSAVGAKLKKTVLRTRLATGRVLESTDNPGTEDLSGVTDRAVLLNAGIAELMSFHTERLANSSSTPLPFNPNALLREYEQMDVDKGARCVLLGLARWVDPQQTAIRMTFRGALAHLRRVFQQAGKLQREQQHRTHIRRAGSRS
jgi:hypothetical protein